MTIDIGKQIKTTEIKMKKLLLSLLILGSMSCFSQNRQENYPQQRQLQGLGDGLGCRSAIENLHNLNYRQLLTVEDCKLILESNYGVNFQVQQQQCSSCTSEEWWQDNLHLCLPENLARVKSGAIRKYCIKAISL